MEERLGYRPALDGVRAIGIALVVGYHAALVPGDGWLGVDLFFVLSGFLITTLLLEERGRTGTVDLAAFYARRALRLLPALAVMLAVYGAARLVAGRFDAADLRGVTFGLFYVANLSQAGWLPDVPRELSHLWSLALEEQFYLVWPPLLAVCLRGRRRLALALVTAGAVAVTSNGWLHLDSVETRLLFAPDTRSAAILVGCAAALAWSLWRAQTARVARVGWVPAVIVLVALAGVSRTPNSTGLFRGGVLLFAVASAALILAAAAGAPPARLLAARPLVMLGRVSYALYLWHLPVFVLFGVVEERTFGHASAGTTVLAVAVALAAAVASYRFVERPFLHRKARLGRRTASAGALDPAAAG